MDIVHRGYPYRITCAIEERLTFDETAAISNVKGMRIKDRTSFTFQYMEYDFTEVIDLSNYDQNPTKLQMFDRLNLIICDPEIMVDGKIDAIFAMMTQAKLEMFEKYEAEVEVWDNKNLMDHLNKPPEFSALVKRFIRNVESLFYVEKEYYNQISKSFLEAPERHIPVISHYLSSIYFKNINNT